MTAPDATLATLSGGFNQAAERLPVLYKLAAEFTRLVDLHEDPDSDPAEIDLELAEVVRDIKAKAFGIAELIKSCERKEGDCKREEERLYAMRKRAETLKEKLKEYARREMEVMGLDRIDVGTHTLAIRLNNPAVEVLDEPAIARVEAYETMPDVPKEFIQLITLYKLDRRALLAHVKATGEVVPGAVVVRRPRLQVS